MNYLQRVEELMDMGMDEDTACREASAELYPESYNADDYDDPDGCNSGGYDGDDDYE